MVGIFIDAANLWEAQKSKRKMFDHRKLKTYLEKFFNTKELEIFYYTAYPGEGTRSYSSKGKHTFYAFLSKQLGYVVRKKKLKQIHTMSDDIRRIQEKGNMDVEMTLDMVRYLGKYDRIALFSGDSDFQALLEYVQSKMKTVYVFSSEKNISQELRLVADSYIDILKITEDIWLEEALHRRK